MGNEHVNKIFVKKGLILNVSGLVINNSNIIKYIKEILIPSPLRLNNYTEKP